MTDSDFDMKNILVVDSDPITLHILVGMLKSHSNFLNTHSAQSIQTALEILDQKKIHVLITGMHIPESDTFKLCLLLPEFCTHTAIAANARDFF